jgi:uncharacterized protein
MITQNLPVAPVKPSRKPFYRSKWFRIPLLVTVLSALVIYIGIGFYGASTFNIYKQRTTDFGDNTPAKYGLKYEDISFKTTEKDGITLRGWWIPNSGSNRTLIVIHGRDSDSSRMLPLARPLWDKGYNLLYFDMRGMGRSDTDRYFFGQKEKYDIVAAFNYTKSRGFDPSRIGLVSHSMGASSSLLALSIDPEIKVVATYSAYADFSRLAEYRIVADNHLPTFFLPGMYMAASIMYGFDIDQTKPDKVLPSLQDRRILLMHGSEDTYVPIDHYYSLLKAGGSNIVDHWVIPGAGHSDAIDLDQFRTDYVNRMTAFFDKELAK